MPEPDRSRARWLFAALPLSFLACAEAAPPAGPRALPPDPAPVAPARKLHAPTLPPLPPDEVPAHLGTPQSSLAARPWWGESLQGYAPQTVALRALFEAAEHDPTDAGALTGEMLVCSAAVSYSEQTLLRDYDQADLSIAVGFGGPVDLEQAPMLAIRGPEDRSEMAFAIPLATLKPRDPIAFRIIDRDVVLDNLIEVVRGKYDGKLPFVVSGKRAQVECRRVPRKAVEEQARLALSELDAAIAKLDVELFPDAEGQGRLPITNITTPFEQVAALVGWDDPRVAVRRARAASLERRFDDEARAAIQALADAQPPLGAWATIRHGERALRVEKMVCGEALAPYRKALPYEIEPRDCVLHLAVKNLGAKTANIGGWSELDGISLRVLDAIANRHTLQQTGRSVQGNLEGGGWGKTYEVAAGATVELLYVLHEGNEFSDTYFNGKPKPLAANVEFYRPILLDAYFQPGDFQKAEQVYLRVP